MLHNLEELVDRYDTFLVDIYGVIYDGVCVPEYASKELQLLHDLHKNVIILSNTTALTEATIKSSENRGLYIGKQYDHLVTSGSAMRDFISKQPKVRIHQLCLPNTTIFAGLPNVEETQNDTEADYIYIGIPKYNGMDIDSNDLFDSKGKKIQVDDLLYHDWSEVRNSQGKFVLREMNDAILRQKAPMLCANSDTFVYINAKEKPIIPVRQGMIALKYERNGGKVIYSGKPYKMIYDYVFATYNLSRNDHIAMVGDTPWTDIAGANIAGIDSILVKTGAYKSYLENYSAEDSSASMETFLGTFSKKSYPQDLNTKPTHIIEQF